MDKQLFIDYLKSQKRFLQLLYDKESTTAPHKMRLSAKVVIINTIIADIEAGYFDITIK